MNPRITQRITQVLAGDEKMCKTGSSAHYYPTWLSKAHAFRTIEFQFSARNYDLAIPIIWLRTISWQNGVMFAYHTRKKKNRNRIHILASLRVGRKLCCQWATTLPLWMWRNLNWREREYAKANFYYCCPGRSHEFHVQSHWANGKIICLCARAPFRELLSSAEWDLFLRHGPNWK